MNFTRSPIWILLDPQYDKDVLILSNLLELESEYNMLLKLTAMSDDCVIIYTEIGTQVRIHIAFETNGSEPPKCDPYQVILERKCKYIRNWRHQFYFNSFMLLSQFLWQRNAMATPSKNTPIKKRI